MGFEENDDVMMCMIANGSYGGTPDFHLVYINVLYGMMLAALYSLTPLLEWYTFSFAVLQILSMTCIAYFVLTLENRARWERVLWLIILYVLWARVIVALQFTTTAGLVSVAGCVMLLRDSWQSRWTGVILVIIGALIRFMAAGLVGLLMAPIILYTYRFAWRKYIPIVVMLTAVVGCRMFNHHTYDKDPEWKYYRAYNQLRAQLNDDPNAYSLKPEQLPEGIDWIDYQLLLRFVPDAEQIDLAAIRKLSAIVGEIPVKNQMRNLHRLDTYAVELSILLALLVLMILTTGNRSKYIFLILYSLFIVLLIIHVSLDGFLKNRVFLCFLLPIVVTDFMLLPDTTGLKRRWGIGIAIIALSGWYGYQIYRERVVAEYNRYNWQRLQQPLLAYVPEDAYVTTIGTSMMMEAVNPWYAWPFAYRKYTLGWMTCSPLNKPLGHSYRTLLRDDMYVFTDKVYASTERSAIYRICQEIEKHYGVPTRIRPICRNGKYELLQIRVKE